MKRAEREDAWRRLDNDWPEDFGLKRFDLSLPGFSPQSVELCGGLTLLCGSNASGKSRVLRALSAALTGDGDGTFSATVQDGMNQLRCPEDGPAPHEVLVIEPFYLCQKQRLSLLLDTNLQDRIEQVDPYSLSAGHLGIVRYLLGRDYDEILVRELDETDESSVLNLEHLQLRGTDALQDVVPFFEVTYRGNRFTSLDLSQGELAGLSLYWALQRCQHHQYVLIEEPESFLSPRSADRSIDVVAHFAGERKFSCVASTHSYLGLAGAPPQHVQLLDATDGISTFVPASQGSIWRSLYVSAPRSLLLYVEDQAALEWLHHLMVRTQFRRVDETDLLNAGGAGEVRKAALLPRAAGERFVAYGVLDGDERAKPFEGRVLFLPGDASIEDLVLRVLRDEVDGAGALVWASADVQAALTATEGLEPHERVDLVAQRLGQPVATLRLVVLDAWLESPEGVTALAEFTASLAEVDEPKMGE